jgi:hypothetical protein
LACAPGEADAAQIARAAMARILRIPGVLRSPFISSASVLSGPREANAAVSHLFAKAFGCE